MSQADTPVVSKASASPATLFRAPTSAEKVVTVFDRIRAELRTLEGTLYYDFYRAQLEKDLARLQAGWVSMLPSNIPK